MISCCSRKRTFTGRIKKKSRFSTNVQKQLSEPGEAGDDLQKQDMWKTGAGLYRCLTGYQDIFKELSVKIKWKASAILSESERWGNIWCCTIDEKLKMSAATGERKIGIERVSRWVDQFWLLCTTRAWRQVNYCTKKGIRLYWGWYIRVLWWPKKAWKYE